MKKLQSTWYNMAIVLTLISVIAGAGLALVNKLTATRIEELKQEKLAQGICDVLQAEGATIDQKDTVYNDKQEVVAIVYTTKAGKAVQATDPNGFGGNLTVLVGFAEDGTIKGYTILESNETPGLGAKAGEWFQADQPGKKSSIIGRTAGDLHVSKEDANGNAVDAITASTITSKAFLRAVNEAYAQYQASNGEQTDVQSGASVQKHNNK